MSCFVVDPIIFSSRAAGVRTARITPAVRTARATPAVRISRQVRSILHHVTDLSSTTSHQCVIAWNGRTFGRVSASRPTKASLGRPGARTVALRSHLRVSFTCTQFKRSPYHSLAQVCGIFEIVVNYLGSSLVFFSGGSEVADAGGPSLPYIDEYVILENMS